MIMARELAKSSLFYYYYLIKLRYLLPLVFSSQKLPVGRGLTVVYILFRLIF